MMPDPAAEADWIEGVAVIRDATGLHARPAVKLTKLAKRFAARVEIRADGAPSWVNAKSPNAVMKLRAGHETRLAIRAAGADADQAVAALEALVEANFDDAAGA
jgi:phosphocarrier protein HPr